MKKNLSTRYHITFTVLDDAYATLTDYIKEAIYDGNLEDAQNYMNDFEFLESIAINGVDVYTLKEYFNLLEHISNIWPEYHIFNDGTHIVIGE